MARPEAIWRFVKFVVFPIAGILVLCELTGPRDVTASGMPRWRVAQFRSWTFLKVMEMSLEEYKRGHAGALPKDLDDPELWNENGAWRKEVSHFRMPPRPDTGVLVYEDPNRWPDGHVWVLFGDSRISWLKRKEFRKLAAQAGLPLEGSDKRFYWWWQ